MDNAPAYVPAYVFIPLFVVAVFLFGTSIWLFSSRLYERMPQRMFLIGILILIGGIVAGVVMMFQPFVLAGFNVGFWFVLISLIGFMYWSHIQPRTRAATPAAPAEETAEETGSRVEPATER